MKLKQRPEDFSVKESYRFEASNGPFRVYLMDKQKLSTFEAIARITQRFGLRPGAVSYCGLKDKQGRTEQLIAVDGTDVDLQDDDLRLKFLGRSDEPLSSANTTSNRFAVTVRQLQQEELSQLNLSAAEVSRLGVVNYFDSQRFGSLKHGQGFIAKDLIRGDFEAALKNYLARPSPLDRSDDAKVKAFWQKNWGDWDARCPFDANKKYARVFKVLRTTPDDFVNAFLAIDADYRAMMIFTYQSYLWNEGVRRLLQLMLPREHLFPMPYQAGTLLFHKDADPAVLAYLRRATFPLLAANSAFRDPKVEEAVKWVLGKEKLSLEGMRIEAAPRLLYFKHEERPVLITPHKLVLGKAGPDELNRGFLKINVAFTLPPGSYATLVIKRLFHFSWSRSHETEHADQVAARAAAPVDTGHPDSGRAEESRGAHTRSPRAESRGEGTGPKPPRPEPRARPKGFLERQRDKKQLKARARAKQ